MIKSDIFSKDSTKLSSAVSSALNGTAIYYENGSLYIKDSSFFKFISPDPADVLMRVTSKPANQLLNVIIAEQFIKGNELFKNSLTEQLIDKATGTKYTLIASCKPIISNGSINSMEGNYHHSVAEFQIVSEEFMESLHLYDTFDEFKRVSDKTYGCIASSTSDLHQLSGQTAHHLIDAVLARDLTMDLIPAVVTNSYLNFDNLADLRFAIPYNPDGIQEVTRTQVTKFIIEATKGLTPASEVNGFKLYNTKHHDQDCYTAISDDYIFIIDKDSLNTPLTGNVNPDSKTSYANYKGKLFNLTFFLSEPSLVKKGYASLEAMEGTDVSGYTEFDNLNIALELVTELLKEIPEVKLEDVQESYSHAKHLNQLTDVNLFPIVDYQLPYFIIEDQRLFDLVANNQKDTFEDENFRVAQLQSKIYGKRIFAADLSNKPTVFISSPQSGYLPNLENIVNTMMHTEGFTHKAVMEPAYGSPNMKSGLVKIKPLLARWYVDAEAGKAVFKLENTEGKCFAEYDLDAKYDEYIKLTSKYVHNYVPSKFYNGPKNYAINMGIPDIKFGESEMKSKLFGSEDSDLLNHPSKAIIDGKKDDLKELLEIKPNFNSVLMNLSANETIKALGIERNKINVIADDYYDMKDSILKGIGYLKRTSVGMSTVIQAVDTDKTQSWLVIVLGAKQVEDNVYIIRVDYLKKFLDNGKPNAMYLNGIEVDKAILANEPLHNILTGERRTIYPTLLALTIACYYLKSEGEL